MENFENILETMRQQCFHMNDEEVSEIVDNFIKTYPGLLELYNREWYIKNC